MNSQSDSTIASKTKKMRIPKFKGTKMSGDWGLQSSHHGLVVNTYESEL